MTLQNKHKENSLFEHLQFPRSPSTFQEPALSRQHKRRRTEEQESNTSLGVVNKSGRFLLLHSFRICVQSNSFWYRRSIVFFWVVAERETEFVRWCSWLLNPIGASLGFSLTTCWWQWRVDDVWIRFVMLRQWIPRCWLEEFVSFDWKMKMRLGSSWDPELWWKTWAFGPSKQALLHEPLHPHTPWPIISP